MSFSTGGGGGSGSISGSTDVFLNNVADDEVLTYDSGTSKWRNEISSGLPTGGATSQVVTKATNLDLDTEWADTATLSNDVPLGWGNPQAGTANTAARADHVHPPSPALGYPVHDTYHANPLGNGINTTASIGIGYIRVSPLPIYKTLKVKDIGFGLRDNVGSKTVEIALFASAADTWLPAARVGGVISATLNDNSFAVQPTYPSGVQLIPGLYWVAVLALGASSTFTIVQGEAATDIYHLHTGPADTTSSYYYNGTPYGAMPATLAGVTPSMEAIAPFYYSFRPTSL